MPNVTYNDYKGKHQHATEVNGSSVDGSDVADGGEANNPLASQIWKPGPHLADMSVSVLFWFSVDCSVFAFFRVVSGDFRVLYSRPHRGSLSFLSFFPSVGQWAPYSG